MKLYSNVLMYMKLSTCREQKIARFLNQPQCFMKRPRSGREFCCHDFPGSRSGRSSQWPLAAFGRPIDFRDQAATSKIWSFGAAIFSEGRFDGENPQKAPVHMVHINISWMNDLQGSNHPKWCKPLLISSRTFWSSLFECDCAERTMITHFKALLGDLARDSCGTFSIRIIVLKKSWTSWM